MKYKIIKYSLFSSLLFLVSCETTQLEITSNPNFLSPEQADADFFLNAVQEDFARLVQSLGNDGAELTRIDYMSGRDYQNAYSPSEFNNESKLSR